MKTLILTLLLGSICFLNNGCQPISAQNGIAFMDKGWDEVLVLAATTQKLIFVDAFTTWCGPCKKMSKEVFPDSSVGAFFNEHFVNVKLNMEKGEGLTFAKNYKVSAYPTLFFIDASGAVIHRVLGGRTKEKLIHEGEKALKAFRVQQDSLGSDP